MMCAPLWSNMCASSLWIWIVDGDTWMSLSGLHFLMFKVKFGASIRGLMKH